MNIDLIKKSIRAIDDFPKPGIIFRDITTLISNPDAFKETINILSQKAMEFGAEKIVAIESRGFIFGAPIAMKLNIPLVIVRKPGKLPHKTVSKSYDLEYGSDSLEIHEDAVTKGDKVVIVDDLLATGGTAAACGSLLKDLGAEVSGWLFVVELDGLSGKSKLSDKNLVYSIVSY